MTLHREVAAPALDAAEVEYAIAGVDAGHRMAEHEPTDFDRELGRRQLRGEITGAEAVELARQELGRQFPARSSRGPVPDRYTYPDSEVLRNLEGIEDPVAAHAAETTFAYQRLVELEQHPIPGQFDLPHLQAIHRHVYQDLWQWAGELRTVDTGTTNTALVHCRPDFIEDEADRIFADLRSDDYLRSMSHERVADRLAYHWGETTVLHPFRDGNSRSQRAFFHQLTREAGWRIDWHGINAAMEQFKHARLAAHAGDHRSLAGVLGKHIDRSANSADTAPGSPSERAANDVPTHQWPSTRSRRRAGTVSGPNVIGYARVSTTEQNPALQHDALQAVGAVRIFTDYASGTSTTRPQLQACLEYLQPGNVLAVWRIDRLGRSVPHLVDTVTALAERGVQFRSLTESIDTTTAGGELVFHIFAALAQMERRLLSERTRAGLDAARARGRVGGRPTVMTPERIETARKLREDGVPVTQIARTFGVGRATVTRALAAAASTSSRSSASSPDDVVAAR